MGRSRSDLDNEPRYPWDRDDKKSPSGYQRPCKSPAHHHERAKSTKHSTKKNQSKFTQDQKRKKSKQKRKKTKNHSSSSTSNQHGKMTGLLKLISPLNLKRNYKCKGSIKSQTRSHKISHLKKSKKVKADGYPVAKFTSKCFCSYCIELRDSIPDHCKAFTKKNDSAVHMIPREKMLEYNTNRGSSTQWSEPSDKLRPNFSIKSPRTKVRDLHWHFGEPSKCRRPTMSNTHIPLSTKLSNKSISPFKRVERRKLFFPMSIGTPRHVFRSTSQYIPRSTVARSLFRPTRNWMTTDYTRRAITLDPRRPTIGARYNSLYHWNNTLPTTIKSSESSSSAEVLTHNMNALWMPPKRNMFTNPVLTAKNVEIKLNFQSKHSMGVPHNSPEKSSESHIVRFCTPSNTSVKEGGSKKRDKGQEEGKKSFPSQGENGVRNPSSRNSQETLTPMSSNGEGNLNSETPQNMEKRVSQTKQPNAEKQKPRERKNSDEMDGKKGRVEKKIHFEEERSRADSSEEEEFEDFSNQDGNIVGIPNSGNSQETSILKTSNAEGNLKNETPCSTEKRGKQTKEPNAEKQTKREQKKSEKMDDKKKCVAKKTQTHIKLERPQADSTGVQDLKDFSQLLHAIRTFRKKGKKMMVTISTRRVSSGDEME